ncbi:MULTISPECIES: hypothetical protein [unclassified Moorena]|uniref:hypothetical protein n=1 Tax=unclassified Moorena TaxID=2683338 RepID=UPI0013FED108|nr:MULTISPECIES: hypothetical protein [unclassified Moorena]NEO14320.1 hypothetical protein [Moorena sp. SIO3E8]NEQ00389.1 hypothetical protein [Moorena sp. SIO3F7]
MGKNSLVLLSINDYITLPTLLYNLTLAYCLLPIAYCLLPLPYSLFPVPLYILNQTPVPTPQQ